MQKYRFTFVYMSAAIPFSLLKFGACRVMENLGALNYALIINISPPEKS